MKSVGIVLSGGGARGAAHIGALKALDELGIKISVISGVSVGAIIGSLYAAGISPDKILEELREQSYFGIRELVWMKSGLFSMELLRKKLVELIGADDFASLKIPLFINATDILTGNPVTFSQGPLFDTILGSAALPVIFEPVPYNDYQLLDGGILDNLPVEPLIGVCDVIIGSHVNKLHDGIKPLKLDKATLIDECFHLVIAGRLKERAKACHIFIEPLLEGFGIFEMKHADHVFQLGYDATMAQKEKLLAMIG